MKIAAYQAPLLPTGSITALSSIRRQLDRCEAEGVEILCCPEVILGGFADNSSNPRDFALGIDNGQLATTLAPLASEVAVLIGFTELTPADQLHNAVAVYHRGEILGVYRKLYPAVNRSIYTPGDEIPVFTVGALTFGLAICNDTNFVEPIRLVAAQGAAVLFAPTNNALRPEKADIVQLARNTDIARAVENGLTVVRADVAGRCEGRVAYGTTAITDPKGADLGTARRLTEDLLIAAIDVAPPKPRWVEGGRKNPAVARAYAQLVTPTAQD